MWNLLPELVTRRFEEGAILVSNTGTIYIPVLAIWYFATEVLKS